MKIYGKKGAMWKIIKKINLNYISYVNEYVFIIYAWLILYEYIITWNLERKLHFFIIIRSLLLPVARNYRVCSNKIKY